MYVYKFFMYIVCIYIYCHMNIFLEGKYNT